MSPIFRIMNWQLTRDFLTALKKIAAEKLPANQDNLIAAVRQQADELYDTNKALILDQPGAGSILISALALAAYRELAAHLGSKREAWQTVQSALTRPQTAWIQKVMRLALRLSRDPLALMANISQKKQLQAYGKGFVFSTHTDNMQTHFATHVHRCLYHEFFKANGAPELTLAFCAFDNIWGDLLQGSEYGVRFDRPTTIAAGEELCRFEFRRVVAGPITPVVPDIPVKEVQ